MKVGIESMNFYPGRVSLNVRDLFIARDLNLNHYENLMMSERSIHLPWETPVSNAVNAAKPIIDQLSDEEKEQIEVVITATESGIDFGKSISTYAHDYLGLSKRCRLFEVKQACYGGTASFQMAINYIASNVSPGAKVLIICTDIARNADKLSYLEPSLGTGALAMLISNQPTIFEAEFGKNGLNAYEVCDTCRPLPSVETGDSDLSLLSYIDCLEACVKDYQTRYSEEELIENLDYIAFHTPFGGMVKGGVRHLMRKLKRMKNDEADALFESKVAPSILIPSLIGNLFSASVYSALLSIVCKEPIDSKKRIGIFSYGSGCSSEFYTGFITPESVKKVAPFKILEKIEDRLNIDVKKYDEIFEENSKWFVGLENKKMAFDQFGDIYKDKFEGKGYLVLDEIKGYHHEYKWS